MGQGSARNTTNRERLKIDRRDRRAAPGRVHDEFGSATTKKASDQVVSVTDEGSRDPKIPWLLNAVVRSLGTFLDNKLARASAPETSQLLAIRARQIVNPASRRELAESWLGLIVAARATPEFLSPKIPLVRERVIDARDMIQLLAEALRGSMPTIRGIAMARSLIVDGAGPIYNRGCSLDLGSMLGDIVVQLDPLTA